MVRYRVTYTVKKDIIEFDNSISKDEIARHLNIPVDSIVNIEIV